jgi:translocation and assembly module TamB
VGKRGVRSLAVAAVLLAMLGLWHWSKSQDAQALLQRQVLAWVQPQLSGTISFQHLSVAGNGVSVKGLQLFGRDGDRLAAVGSLSVRVDLLGLVSKRLVVRSMALEDFDVCVTNRCLTQWKSVAAQERGAPSSSTWSAVVQSLQLFRGTVRLEDEVVMRDVSGEGSAEIDALRRALEGDLLLRAQSDEGEASLKVKVTALASGQQAEISADWGASSVESAVRWPTLQFDVRRAALSPRQLRRVLPEWPFGDPVNVTLKHHGLDTYVEAQLPMGSAQLRLLQEAKAPDQFEVKIHLDRVGVNTWVNLGEPMTVTADVEGALDMTAGSAEGTVKAQLNDARVSPPLSLESKLRWANGVLTWSAAKLTLPGARAETQGQLSAEGETDAQLQIWANEVRETVQFLNRLAPGRVEPVNGRGRVTASLKGRWPRLQVEANGNANELVVPGQSLRVQNVAFALSLADATQPLTVSGVVTADALAWNEKKVSQLQGVVVNRGRSFEASLSTLGLGDVAVELAGERLKAGGALFTAGRLRTAKQQWSLAQPARLTVDGDRIELQDFVLSSGAQRVEVSVRTRGAQAQVGAELSAVEIGQWPEVLVPARLGLAGRVSGRLQLEKSRKGLTGDVAVAVQHAAIQNMTFPEVRLTAHSEGTQVRATFDATGDLGQLAATAEVQLTTRLDAVESFRGSARVERLGLVELGKAVQRPWFRQGVLEGQSEFSGSPAEPEITGTLAIKDLIFATTKGDVQLDDVSCDFRLTASSASADGQALLQGAPLAWHLASEKEGLGFLSQRPDSAALKRVPWQARLTARDLSLAAVAQFFDLPAIDGQATTELTFGGTLESPQGRAKIELQGGRYGRLTEVDGSLELALTDKSTVGGLELKRQRQPMLSAAVSVDEALWRLQSESSLRRAQISGRARLYPFEMSTVLPTSFPVQGIVSLTALFEGPIAEAALSLNGRVEAAAFGETKIDGVNVLWRGPAGAQQLVASVIADRREVLSVSGELAAGGRAGPWSSPQFALKIKGENVPVAPLSMVSKSIRSVEGWADVSGEVTGTLSQPQWRGTGHWRKGQVSVWGMGEYRDIDLAVDATADTVTVERLTFRAGSGLATLKARAVRQPGGAFRLGLEGNATKVPVINDDQLLADVSLSNLQAQANLTEAGYDFFDVSFGRAEIALPELKRKNLQALERPEGVVLAGSEPGVGVTKARPRSQANYWRFGLNAPRNIWLRSGDVNLELGLSEDFRVDYATAAQAFGELRLLQGRVDVFGRQFQIASRETGVSTLRFDGSPTVPLLNVVAIHSNEKEKVKVTATIAGRGKNAQLTLSSDPPLNESDIYTLLATGRRDLRRNANSSITPEQALSVVGSVAASQLRGALAKKLPLDVLSLDTGSDGVKSTRLELGTYLSDRFYLGSTVQPGANQSRGESIFSGRLEYQISKSWSFEGNAGTAPTFGFDVVWSRDF